MKIVYNLFWSYSPLILPTLTFLSSPQAVCLFKLIRDKLCWGVRFRVPLYGRNLTGFMHAIIIPINSYMQLSYCAPRTVWCSYWHVITFFLPLLPQWSLRTLRTRCNIYVPVRADNLAVFYSLHLGQSWGSVLTTVYYK